MLIGRICLDTMAVERGPNQFVTDEAIGNKQQGLKLLEFFCGRSLGVVVGPWELDLVLL